MQIAKRIFIDIMKGFFIGIGTLIPGVSGGTTAIIVGAFESIMEAIANFLKDIKKSLRVIIPIGIGAVPAILLTSKMINTCMQKYPTVTNISFLLLSIISSAFFVKKKIEFSITVKRLFCLIIGIAIAMLITLSKNAQGIYLESYEWYLLIIFGLPLSLALILPAISFSYMMYFFGLYEPFLIAIETFDFQFIIYLALGVVLGSIVFAKLFVKLSEKYTQEIYYFIFGFVLCSNMDILFRILNY